MRFASIYNAAECDCGRIKRSSQFVRLSYTATGDIRADPNTIFFRFQNAIPLYVAYRIDHLGCVPSFQHALLTTHYV